MSVKTNRAKGTKVEAKAGKIGTKPLIGLAAGAAVGSAAIAAALIFSGRLRNPFIDAETIKDDGLSPAKPSRGSKASAASQTDTGEEASFKRGEA
jgi:hypothetical protein